MNTSSQHSQCNLVNHCFSGLLLGILLSLSGCATTGPGAGTVSNVDPYENINRKIYTFNDKVDDYVAKPVSDAYKFITPQFMQTGVYNFFNNLKNINVVLNDVLQAKFDQSAHDTGRFLMNTTLGMAGLFDVAKTVGLEANDEDFEQTLAVWGVPQGTYLVLPLLGPITTRGIPGAVFDTAANPANYVGMPVQVISLINTRANAEGSLKFIDEAALDPYVFTRESFLQWRNHLATDGNDSKASDLSDLDADLMADDKKTAQQPAATKNAPTIGSASAINKTVEKTNTAPVLPAVAPTVQPTDPAAKK